MATALSFSADSRLASMATAAIAREIGAAAHARPRHPDVKLDARLDGSYVDVVISNNAELAAVMRANPALLELSSGDLLRELVEAFHVAEGAESELRALDDAAEQLREFTRAHNIFGPDVQAATRAALIAWAYDFAGSSYVTRPSIKHAIDAIFDQLEHQEIEPLLRDGTLVNAAIAEAKAVKR